MRSRARPSPRIPRDVPTPKRGPDPKRSASHLDFLRGLPCCACGRAPRSEAAHIRLGTDGGIGTKPSDRWCLPLCGADHARQHQVGEVQYWSGLGVDPYGLATHLWLKSGDQAAGERAVMRMVMEITTRRMAG